MNQQQPSTEVPQVRNVLIEAKPQTSHEAQPTPQTSHVAQPQAPPASNSAKKSLLSPFPIISMATIHNKKSSLVVSISWNSDHPFSVPLKAYRVDINHQKERLGILCDTESRTLFRYTSSSKSKYIALSKSSIEYMFGLGGTCLRPRWSSLDSLEIIIMLNDLRYSYFLFVPAPGKTSTYTKITPICDKIDAKVDTKPSAKQQESSNKQQESSNKQDYKSYLSEDVSSENAIAMATDEYDEDDEKYLEDEDYLEDEEIVGYIPKETTSRQKSNKRKISAGVGKTKRRKVSSNKDQSREDNTDAPSPMIMFENDTISVVNESEETKFAEDAKEKSDLQPVEAAPQTLASVQQEAVSATSLVETPNNSLFYNYNRDRMSFMQKELEITRKHVKILKIREAALMKCIESQLEFEKIDNVLNMETTLSASMRNNHTIELSQPPSVPPTSSIVTQQPRALQPPRPPQPKMMFGKPLNFSIAKDPTGVEMVTKIQSAATTALLKLSTLKK